jgi:hypothetical protein
VITSVQGLNDYKLPEKRRNLLVKIQSEINVVEDNKIAIV